MRENSASLLPLKNEANVFDADLETGDDVKFFFSCRRSFSASRNATSLIVLGYRVIVLMRKISVFRRLEKRDEKKKHDQI